MIFTNFYNPTKRNVFILIFGVGCVLSSCNPAKFSGNNRRKAAIPPVQTIEFDVHGTIDGTASFKQGEPGTPLEQKFVAPPRPKLDILVVIDNSRSMAMEQTKLSSKLAPLLSAVKSTDWQIKVVTTDPHDGCPDDLVKKDDVDAGEHFARLVSAGISGATQEQGINQAVVGLKCSGSPWVRSDSSLAVLIVSDEDNCSDGLGCHGIDNSDTPLREYLSTIRTLGKNTRVYGIIMGPGVPTCELEFNKVANIYAKIINDSAGKWGSICDSDYTSTLTAISTDISSIVDRDFELEEQPEEGSLKVFVAGKETKDYVLNGTKITLNESIDAGSEVKASYSFGKQISYQGEWDKFDGTPLAESVKVMVDGTEYPADSYTFDKAQNKVVFKVPPKQGASVEVKYQYVGVKSVYSIGTGIDPNSIKLEIDGSVAPDTKISYDVATGMITLAPAPTDKTKIKVSFEKAK